MKGSPDRLLKALAREDSPTAFRAAALKRLREIVPFDLGAYYEVDAASGVANAVVFPEQAFFDGAERAWASTIDQDPFMRHYGDTADGAAHRLSDLVPPERFPEHPKYDAMYRPLQMVNKLSMVVEEAPLGGAPVTRPRISIYRRDRDFTDDEVAFMNAVRVPLARIRRDAAERALTAAVQALGDDGSGPGQWGVVFLRPDSTRERRVEADVVQREFGLDVSELARSSRNTSDLGLTPRETEVLDLVSAGLGNSEVAHRLGISPSTVAKRLEHIFKKLHVQSRSEAVHRARPRDP